MILRALKYLLILMVCYGYMACKAGKRTTNEHIKITKRSKTYVLKALQSHQIETPIFNAKAKIKYDDGEQKIAFTSNLRMVRDSFIWFNGSILGFEGARILIRPDSIFVINRLERSYVAERYGDFDKKFKIPVTFNQLQDLLLGNALLTDQQPSAIKLAEERYHISQKTKHFSTTHEIDARNFWPVLIQAKDSQSGYSVDVEMRKQKPLEESGIFSYFRHYIVKNDNVQFANIQINFIEIDISQKKKAPFKIPDRFTRVD